MRHDLDTYLLFVDHCRTLGRSRVLALCNCLEGKALLSRSSLWISVATTVETLCGRAVCMYRGEFVLKKLVARLEKPFAVT